MDFDSILRKIYKSKTFYELEKCAECIYESYYLDRELNQIEKEELCRIAEKQGNRILCFMADPDTTAGKPVFNKTVGLTDNWAKKMV